MTHTKHIIEAGPDPAQATGAMLLLHGRGADAQDIMALRREFHFADSLYCAAPQATNYTWYPYSFMAPVEDNEPWLSSAIGLLDDIIANIESRGITSQQIFITGFSQGACLALEFATRRARKWAGVIAFTGGLIGKELHPENYQGDFNATRVYIGTSDRDPHVPLARSQESKTIIERLGGDVTLDVYANMPHTVHRKEIDAVNALF